MPWQPANPERRQADLDRLAFLSRLVRARSVGWEHAVDEVVALHDRIAAEDRQQRENTPPYPWWEVVMDDAPRRLRVH